MTIIKILQKTFYARGAEKVAKDLIGKVICRCVRGKILRARIVETEAYIGTHDLACHASKGRTKRTEVMFGPPGHAYVYLIYGIYNMFNIVSSHEGDPQAVLIRAAELLESDNHRLLAGPGKLARELKITRKLNGAPLFNGELFLTGGEKVPRIKRTKRIGVDYSGVWKHAPLRFYDESSHSVSRR